jgi:hypothetical protein
MITKSRLRDPSNRFMSVGEYAYLDGEIDVGLFEACNGDRYLIVQTSAVFRVAISLSHGSRGAFRWTALEDRPIQYGRWWGPWQLTLNHAFPEQKEDRRGIITCSDGELTMECRGRGGAMESIFLGPSRGASNSFAFDAWSIHAKKVEFPFLEHFPDGLVSLGTVTRWNRPARPVIKVGYAPGFDHDFH